MYMYIFAVLNSSIHTHVHSHRYVQYMGVCVWLYITFCNIASLYPPVSLITWYIVSIPTSVGCLLCLGAPSKMYILTT